MPVTFRVLPDHNLVHVRCFGDVSVGQSRAAFDQYTQHADYHPGQSQLIDLSAVTQYERDFANIMSLQAHLLDAFVSVPVTDANASYLIYVAPTELTQAMAMASLRSWRGIPGVVPLVLGSLTEALSILAISPETWATTSESVE